jgi:hypothetical protein
VDPHEEDKGAFKDLPNRFPSVLSSDFRKEQDHYEDIDNLFAMYLLDNLSKYRVRVSDKTKLLEIDKSKEPMSYPEAAEVAIQSAKLDSENFRRRLKFQSRGTEIGHPNNETGKTRAP